MTCIWSPSAIAGVSDHFEISLQSICHYWGTFSGKDKWVVSQCLFHKPTLVAHSSVSPWVFFLTLLSLPQKGWRLPLFTRTGPHVAPWDHSPAQWTIVSSFSKNLSLYLVWWRLIQVWRPGNCFLNQLARHISVVLSPRAVFLLPSSFSLAKHRDIVIVLSIPSLAPDQDMKCNKYLLSD